MTDGPAPEALRVLEHVQALRDEMVDFLVELARSESPTNVPASQLPVQRLMADALELQGYRVRKIPGRATGGHLYARARDRAVGAPAQLLVGHSDTVWPRGTLAEMPVRVEAGRVMGPGTFDMKGGLVQIVFALRALRELELVPAVSPVVFVNSDEETGSPESRRWVARLARRVCRAYILEPSMGIRGRVKTRRKGVGHFTLRVQGRPAHAGLEPQEGASAIVALSELIQRLHGLNDRERGVTVNVGVVEGGSRANVVAATARADVDVRVLDMEDGRRVAEAIHSMESATPGVGLEVEGGMQVPPLEPTSRNRRLWEDARKAGRHLGLELEETTAGGASDGNTTSRFTATLDGLGPVGDGAHARHEHVEIDGMVERCALLALLLLLPVQHRDE